MKALNKHGETNFYMKVFAKVLTVITIAALLLAGYVVWTANAQVNAEGYQIKSAADNIDAFNNVISALRSGSDAVVGYETEGIGSAEDYVFVIYTIRVRNSDLVSIEWIDLELENKPGDVLMMKPVVQDIPALNQSILSYTLMLPRGAADYERTATLSYYIYGHYKEVPLTLK